MRRAAAAPAGLEDRVCVAELSGQLVALRAAAVAAALPMARLARPPNRPPILEGLLSLPDGALPVLRLSHLLGLPDRPPTAASAILRLRGERPRGLLVDRVRGLQRVRADDLQPIEPGSSFADVAIAGLGVAGEPCLLLDPARLLLREEEARLDAFRALGDRRLADLGPEGP
ncbi:chemotaxis protein CheW [Azospirillum oleiclasticum]|uniref:Chemotaxis protein CheW n=1 Tax=Azospirillum oleiclasticum TaxID=2735135 RepID=A0ABX2TJR9_9PROT|nr:chemotaxis protein CheW [Azospirillum oleiclasticum]NYZ23586.1 chemotaxis protein CheW [Azospirillum oleiclasticum]